MNRLHIVAIGAASLLAGCAALTEPPVAVGQTEAQAVAALGAPTGRYALPEGGTRLEFARGPFGRETWMVDLGADGRSRRVAQVLDWANLYAVSQRARGMETAELLREIGRPAERMTGLWNGGQVWSWRFPTNECLWFQVDIGADGKVVGGGQAIDPRCDYGDPNKD